MFGTTTVAGFAAVAFVIGLVLRRKRIGAKAIPWLFLIAGLGMAGVLGDLLVNLGGGLQNAGTIGSATLFGVPVPTLAAIVMTLVLVIDLMPKKSPTGLTPWLALIVPSVWIASGGQWAELGNTGDNVMATAGTSFSTFAEQFVSGVF
jgi:hypothetical protein